MPESLKNQIENMERLITIGDLPGEEQNSLRNLLRSLNCYGANNDVTLLDAFEKIRATVKGMQNFADRAADNIHAVRNPPIKEM